MVQKKEIKQRTRKCAGANEPSHDPSTNASQPTYDMCELLLVVCGMSFTCCLQYKYNLRLIFELDVLFGAIFSRWMPIVKCRSGTFYGWWSPSLCNYWREESNSSGSFYRWSPSMWCCCLHSGSNRGFCQKDITIFRCLYAKKEVDTKKEDVICPKFVNLWELVSICENLCELVWTICELVSIMWNCVESVNLWNLWNGLCQKCELIWLVSDQFTVNYEMCETSSGFRLKQWLVHYELWNGLWNKLSGTMHSSTQNCTSLCETRFNFQISPELHKFTFFRFSFQVSPDSVFRFHISFSCVKPIHISETTSEMSEICEIFEKWPEIWNLWTCETTSELVWNLKQVLKSQGTFWCKCIGLKSETSIWIGLKQQVKQQVNCSLTCHKT